jgi:hypothetical protein
VPIGHEHRAGTGSRDNGQPLDARNADVYNRHFADDILWGSPFGATVPGYQQLHAIHDRLRAEGRGGPSSRYEIESVLAPSPNVAIAHVRRVALDPDGQPLEPTSAVTDTFSEMALYLLVRHEGTWWLVAGRTRPSAPGRRPA